jgi:cytochrome c oxidase subunit 2
MTPRRQTIEIVALVVLFLSITLFTVVGFTVARWLPPPAASRPAAGVDGVIHYLILTTGVILLIGTLAMVVFLWRFGRGRPAPSPRITPRNERWVTMVPVLGMALIAEAGVLVKGLPVWEQVYGKAPEDALVIEVNAQQFEWIVRYPGPDGTFGRSRPELVNQMENPAGIDARDPAAADDIVVRNRIYVPVDRPVFLRLQARDVLHSVAVPAFRVKQDIVPGKPGSTQFVPITTGEYEIACAELCGMGHYKMGGRVFVYEPDEYERWVSSQPGFVQP